jgi:hypothetical protein
MVEDMTYLLPSSFSDNTVDKDRASIGNTGRYEILDLHSMCNYRNEDWIPSIFSLRE